MAQDQAAAARLAALLRPEHLDGVVLVARGGNYRRGNDGVWRYAFSGDPVPGAADVTLAERYAAAPRRRINDHEHLLLDQAWANRPELEWCAAYAVKGSRSSGTATETLAIPLDEFIARGPIVVDLRAPELHPEDMLTTAQVAALAGVRPDTIAGYRSRGQMPQPAAQIGGRSTPLWPRPVIRHWLAHQTRRHRT